MKPDLIALSPNCIVLESGRGGGRVGCEMEISKSKRPTYWIDGGSDSYSSGDTMLGWAERDLERDLEVGADPSRVIGRWWSAESRRGEGRRAHDSRRRSGEEVDCKNPNSGSAAAAGLRMLGLKCLADEEGPGVEGAPRDGVALDPAPWKGAAHVRRIEAMVMQSAGDGSMDRRGCAQRVEEQQRSTLP